MAGIRWSEEEKDVLRKWWSTTHPIRMWINELPGKSRQSIIGVGRRMKLGERPRIRKQTHTQSWLCIEQLLSDGKMRDAGEIATLTGFSDRQVRAQIRQRIGQDLFVADWRQDFNRYTALIALGQNKANAPKPKAKTKAAIQRIYMKRMQYLAPAKHEEKLKQERVRNSVNRPAPQQADPAASWLFNQC